MTPSISGIVAALALTAGAPYGSHPNSLSSSVIEVAGRTVRHDLVLQPTSLFEVQAELDANGDGAFDGAELIAAGATIEEYVARHYRLFADDGFQRELARTVETIELARPPFPAPPDAPDWVRIVSSFDAVEPLEALAVEMRLFFLSSPDHRDLCSVTWDGVAAFAASLSQFEPRHVFRRADVPLDSWWGWIRAGFLRFALGFEQLAFLLALLAAARDPRAALGAALAFGLGRWLGYGFELTEIASVPARFVDLTVALSSAFIGAQILLARERRPLHLEAAVFGAMHGLALARAAGDATAALERPLAAELLYGLGIELAALSILGIAASSRALLDARRAGERRSGRIGPLRASISIAAIALGLYWFAARAGWL